LSEGVLEEAGVGLSHNAYIMVVEMYVDDLLVVGASYGDGSGEADFDRGVCGGEHGV
jgi:hypothetical protein